METLTYLLKSSLLLAIFLLCYRFLLARETFYTFNRLFLFFGMLAAVLVPALVYTRIVYVAPVDLNAFSTINLEQASFGAQGQSGGVDFWEIALFVYLVGMLAFLLHFLYESISLFLYLKKQDFQPKNGLFYVEIPGLSAPFSFLKYIVYDPQAHTPHELEMILQHERAHARQLHSLDVLLGRLFCIALWFNPLSWVYVRLLKQNLEFLADSCVARQEFSLKTYQFALLKNATGSSVPQLAQSFYKSFIKKRITMLNTKQSSGKNRFKVLVLVPFLAAFLYSFNMHEETRVMPKENAPTSAISYPSFTLSERSTESDINRIMTYFKEEIADLNINISVKKRDAAGNILQFDFLTQFLGDQDYNSRLTRKDEGSFKPYQIQYLGDGKLLVNETGNDSVNFIITKEKLQISKNGKLPFSAEKSVENAKNLKDKPFRFEIGPITTEAEMKALATQLKEEYNVQFKFNTVSYNDDDIIIAVNLEMKDLRNKNVSKLNLNNSDGLGTIVLFRSEQGTLGFTSGGSSSSTTTSSMTSNTISGSGSMVQDSLAQNAQTEALQAQQQAMEVAQQSIAQQKEALERQREALEQQQKALQQKQQEMDKFMEQQQEAYKKKAAAIMDSVGDYSLKSDYLDKNILYILDGEEITEKEMNLLENENIESINVFKDGEMIKKYGDRAKGKDGVIDIKLKKGN